MSDTPDLTPERIWAHSCDPSDAGGVWVPWETDGREYIRADLHEAERATERARVAELEGAMLAITQLRVNPNTPRGMALFKTARKIAVAALKGPTR